MLPLIIIFLIVSAISFKGYATLWSKNKKLKDEIAKKTEEITKGSGVASLKKTAEVEIKELEAILAAIEKSFPSSNTEEVFSSLNRFIEASQISLKAISPLEKTEVAIASSKDKYLELPITLRFDCSYDQLVSFLSMIEDSNKLMIVTEVKIQSNPSYIWDHNIEVSLKVPMLLFQPNN